METGQLWESLKKSFSRERTSSPEPRGRNGRSGGRREVRAAEM